MLTCLPAHLSWNSSKPQSHWITADLQESKIFPPFLTLTLSCILLRNRGAVKIIWEPPCQMLFLHTDAKWKWSHSVVSDSLRPHGLQPTRLLCPWDSPGKNIWVGCHFLLQGKWTPKRHIKRCSSLLIIRQMQIKTTEVSPQTSQNAHH